MTKSKQQQSLAGRPASAEVGGQGSKTALGAGNLGAVMFARLDPKIDVVFKLLFSAPGNHELLVSLLTAVLQPTSPIAVARVLNPDIPKDALGDKGIVLDVHLELKDGRHVDVEMQSARQASFSARALYYLARLYSSNLHKGEEYGALKSCVSILILGYRQWATERFHCTFHVSEDRSHERFSDAIEIHTVELAKVPSLGVRPPGEGAEPALSDWGVFLAARSEAELEVLAMKNPDIARAKSALDTLSADPAARQLAEMRSKAEVAYQLEIAAQRAEAAAEAEARGRAEGELDTKREVLLKLFAGRGLAVSDGQRSRILECADPRTLDRWIDRAFQATSVEAVLE